MNFRCPKLLELARDQACANCGSEDGTVVAAHSNWMEHGKGKSIKAHDCFIAFLCMACHQWLDQGTWVDPTNTFVGDREGKKAMFRRAMEVTMFRLWQSGRIGVK